MINYPLLFLLLVWLGLLIISPFILLKITEPEGLLESKYGLNMSVTIDGYQIKSTFNHVLAGFIVGIMFCILPLPAIIYKIEFFPLLTLGITFLYVAIVMYYRKDVFNDNELYYEKNEYYNIRKKTPSLHRRFRYIDVFLYILPIPMLIPLTLSCAFTASFDAISIPTLLKYMVMLSSGIVIYTLYLFPDKLNIIWLNLFKCDIRSTKGFNILSIFNYALPILYYVIVYLIKINFFPSFVLW